VVTSIARSSFTRSRSRSTPPPRHTRSAAAPTAFRGRLDEAIDECKKAIAVDQTFGNRYNDIGSYLVNKGKLDEAIEWLEKAKTAPRYEPRHFPYMNQGRIYAQKGMVLRAIQEFEAALEIHAGEPTCLSALGQLRGALN